MEWGFVVVLVLVIPFIAFPVLLWYLDICGSYKTIRKPSNRRASAREESNENSY